VLLSNHLGFAIGKHALYCLCCANPQNGLDHNKLHLWQLMPALTICYIPAT